VPLCTLVDALNLGIKKLANNRPLTLFGYKNFVLSTGTIVETDIFDTDKIKLITENANGANEIKIYAKLSGQNSWNLLNTLTGTSEVTVIVDTYHQLKIECTVLDGTFVKLIGSGFTNVC
jgi:hypothetical protein